VLVVLLVCRSSAFVKRRGSGAVMVLDKVIWFKDIFVLGSSSSSFAVAVKPF
jgi:hypothetical protein